ncbi:hypothetical protein DM02DRAFT_626955 [Periconia macrospinosa]|uniref:Cytochrome P450 n=1 Tax=Periconia macrospinosa TaxID=97972 RepID=A0A2V1DYJ0_9PLEO|nr:hypothetical protein DM02DRAFT_626955 [Periconia macrospinosa]
MKENTMITQHLASYLVHHAFGMSKSVASEYFTKCGELAMHKASHEINHRLLLGPNSKGFASRFQVMLTRTIVEKRNSNIIGDSWEVDLLNFFHYDVAKVVVDAMFGKSLLRMSPNFLTDFWNFDAYLIAFMLRIPRFLVPEGFASRQRAVNAVRIW